MYQTNTTNSPNSFELSKSLLPFQQDLWTNEEQNYNPDQIIAKQVFEHYHQQLNLQPKLIEMLVGRKIDPAYIGRFQIGFADRTLGREMQSPKCLQGSRNRGHLQRLGLLKNTGHEFFRGALVFPYLDRDHQIIGAYGRRPKLQRRSPAYHLYWNSQKVPLFSAIDRPLPKTLILCKSSLDLLTLLTAGIDNVVATMGVEGFNDTQLTQLQDDGVRKVYIAFDNTPAANRYALLVAQALEAIGICCFRVSLPLGQDVNRFAMSQSDVAKSFNRLMKSSVTLQPSYSKLRPDLKDLWLKQWLSIEECISFYLEELRQGGRALRTLNAARVQLNRFQDYCYCCGIDQINDVNSGVLDDYHRFLSDQKKPSTGRVISLATRQERMNVVTRMLVRLYYYGIISEPVDRLPCGGPLHLSGR